ncbi:MAG: histidine phosphotransferase family protein [Pseudomonadota bacterium]
MAIDLAARSIAANAVDAATADHLCGLVAARVCHDLVGPVGAIANGVDLLAEFGAGAEDEMTLLRQSTDRAATMLRTLRLAFGHASADGQRVERRTLERDLTALMGGRRVHIAMLGTDGPSLSAPTARLVTLMVLSGRLILGLTGSIEITFSHDGDLPLRAAVEGPKVDLKPATLRLLRGDLTTLPSSREVEFALLPLAADAAGARLDVVDDEASVTMTACLAG